MLLVSINGLWPCARKAAVHFGIGLIAKPFAPRVPLIVLAFAGVLPDAKFFLLQFFGIETFNFGAGIARRGCFPYTNDYPYSHSLAGMVIVGEYLAFFKD